MTSPADTELADKPKKKSKKPAAIQPKGELPGMPPITSPLGIAVHAAKEAALVYDKAAKDLGVAKANLFKAMKNAKTFLVPCGGYKFHRTHTGPKDGIKIEKPK